MCCIKATKLHHFYFFEEILKKLKFLGPKKIRFCYEVDHTFSVPNDVIEREIESSANVWREYMKSRKIHLDESGQPTEQHLSLNLERLENIVGGAGIPAVDRLFHRGVGRDHNDLNGWLRRLDAPQELDTVHFGHVNVGQNHVKFLQLDHIDRL